MEELKNTLKSIGVKGNIKAYSHDDKIKVLLNNEYIGTYDKTKNEFIEKEIVIEKIYANNGEQTGEITYNKETKETHFYIIVPEC